MICCDEVESRKNIFDACNKILKNELHKFKAIITKENYKHYCKASVQENISTRHYNTYFQTTPNKLGCNLSYGRLLKYLDTEKKDFDWFLILEDDVIIDNNINCLLTSIVEQATDVDSKYVRLEHSDYTYICSGTKYSPEIQFDQTRKVSEHLYTMMSQYGTTGQLISKAGIKTILNNLPFDDHVDNFISKHSRVLNATVYIDNIVKTLGDRNYSDKTSSIPSLINNVKQPRKFSAAQLHDHNE